MIIGLHGRAGSGKDTVCDMIRDWARDVDVTVRRDAFADRLKLSAARLFFPDIELEEAVGWCNRLKEEGRIMHTSNHGELARAVSGREFLQRYGTESHRDVFGDDFWVDAALHVGDEDVLVITDVRFRNEAEAIRARGGEIWQILRLLRNADVRSEHAHVSEAPLAPELINWRILNDGSLDDLRDRVYAQMTFTRGRSLVG